MSIFVCRGFACRWRRAIRRWRRGVGQRRRQRVFIRQVWLQCVVAYPDGAAAQQYQHHDPRTTGAQAVAPSGGSALLRARAGRHPMFQRREDAVRLGGRFAWLAQQLRADRGDGRLVQDTLPGLT